MLANYARFILRHRRATIVLVLLAVAAMGTGARYLTFTNDYRVFFGADNPQLLAFEKLQNTYSRNDNAMFVLAPDDGEVFTRESLGAIAWLTERAWQTPYSTRVESITNYQHTSAEGDDLIVENLGYRADALEDDALLQIRDIALNEPVLVNRLVSPQGRVAGVNITIALP